MTAEPARLLDLAASVADGTADIDWDEVEAGLSDVGDRELLRDLKLLAGVAAVHRETPARLDRSASQKVVGRITPAHDPDLPTVEEYVLPVPSRAPLERWGHLVLVEQIGQGSFGHVYRAHDTRLDRDVALKLLRPGRQAAELAGKILHEGRILARVRHRNVVTVFGAEERDGRVGLWMEYIRGRTLEQLLRSQGPFGAREAALIGQELCRALAAVHKAGLVHRDVKAQNVMREEGGRLVLMDFGAGQDTEGPAATGRLTGTPLYLAPELLHSGEATIQSDIYSLGVVLFHLVTGQYPVHAGSLDDLRAAHAGHRRLRLHDARPDLADDFVRVVERALHAEPRRRYASAGAMQDALARSLGLDSTIPVVATPADAPPAPRGRPAGRPAMTRRSRRWAMVAAAGFAGGMALAAALAVVWPAVAPPAVVRRATVLAPVVVVRPMVAEPADPLTVALAGDLAQALGTSPDIRVTSSHAVDTLNRPGEPSAAIMGALQADVLVEVLPVTRRGDELHANVRLLVANAVLLTLPPQGPAADVAALTDQVLAVLGPRLRVDTASLRPVSARAQFGATSPDVLQRYRRGALLLGQGANEVLADAAGELRAAMELDPEFAQAYALWAQALMRRYRAGQVTAADAFDLTRTAIAQALVRDPENSDAFAVAADLYAEEARDWARAESEFQRALSLSPSNEYARTRYAMLLSARGRTTEAVDQMEEARRLAPLSSTLQGYLGMTLHYAGRDEEALRLFERLHTMDRGWGAALVGLCRVYTSVGKYGEAMTACAEVERRQTEQQPFVAAQRAAILAGQGRTREAEAVAADLAARFHAAPPGERADLAFFTAVAQVALRQFDEAFTWLDLATEARSSRLLYVRIDPRFTALRSDPRFASVVARVDQGL